MAVLKNYIHLVIVCFYWYVTKEIKVSLRALKLLCLFCDEMKNSRIFKLSKLCTQRYSRRLYGVDIITVCIIGRTTRRHNLVIERDPISWVLWISTVAGVDQMALVACFSTRLKKNQTTNYQNGNHQLYWFSFFETAKDMFLLILHHCGLSKFLFFHIKLIITLLL